MIEYPLARTDQGFGVGRHAGTAQRRVTFNGTVDVALRRIVVTFPGAIVSLCLEQGCNKILFAGMATPQKMHG